MSLWFRLKLFDPFGFAISENGGFVCVAFWYFHLIDCFLVHALAKSELFGVGFCIWVGKFVLNPLFVCVFGQFRILSTLYS